MTSSIEINAAKCTGCGVCLYGCSGRVFEYQGGKAIIPEGANERCIYCGHCVCLCPVDAISLSTMSPSDVVPIVRDRLPSTEQFAELVKYRRSVRHYRREPVKQSDLDQLFEIVRWAPTAKNLLKTKWIVVNHPDTVHRLAGIAVDSLRQSGNAPNIVEAWDRGYDWIHRGAPCLIVAYTEEESVWTHVDSTIAVETMDLAASTMGLGACWAGLLMHFLEESNELRQAFRLEPGNQVGAALMLGYPDAEIYTKAPLRPQCPVRYLED